MMTLLMVTLTCQITFTRTNGELYLYICDIYVKHCTSCMVHPIKT
uniref:Uncharacterized protein n=1 Tax=Anguilla anguilla TaxID=7936 RepID=A0A0E9RWJ1_ANGAN